ncbi:hypothetical protein B0H14DRAFT_2635657 [Mycena olivaceomarginata]|nr:hypothetical protein B0H14DRAFT_2635657 [Mycena olivaceomarginata]
MELWIWTEYQFLSFASILALGITNNHANPTTDGEDMVIAASGSKQAVRILGHTNYQQVGYGLKAPLHQFQTHLYSGKSGEKWFKRDKQWRGQRDIDQPKPSTATRSPKHIMLWASDLQAQDPIKHFGVVKAC